MIPKAELHVHLEFTALPSLIKKIAERNHYLLPDGLIGLDETYHWKDFYNFLDVTEKVSRAIQTQQDYYDVTYDYLMRCAQAGAVYVEVMPSSDHAMLSGLPYAEMVEGVAQAIKDAKSKFNIESRMMMAAVRHFGVEKCEAVAKLVVGQPHPLVTGLCLAGDEINFPPRLFKKTFEIAHDAGLGCMCHAGEWVGPEGVKEAIDELKVERIGHGVRAIEDIKLVNEIVERGITLECAPGSNIALGVYPDYAAHPFKKLKDLGVKVTLNSDDPPYFKTSLAQEYDMAQREFKFTNEEMIGITRNAINAAFCDEKTRENLLQRL